MKQYMTGHMTWDKGSGIKLSFAVDQHPYSPKHFLLKVYAKGKCFACPCGSHSDDELQPSEPPTTSAAQYAWRHQRHMFLPYDEHRGMFVNREFVTKKRSS